MTDESPTTTTPDDLHEAKVRTVEGIKDLQLVMLCRLAQKSEGFLISVTLDVQGTVITGELIGRNAWFDEQIKRLSERGEAAASLAEAMATIGKRDEDDADDDHIESFVHLRDAYRITGDDARPHADGETGLMWRGRIGSVDGWSVGYLSSGG